MSCNTSFLKFLLHGEKEGLKSLKFIEWLGDKILAEHLVKLLIAQVFNLFRRQPNVSFGFPILGLIGLLLGKSLFCCFETKV
jgi:hypothetical protein